MPAPEMAKFPICMRCQSFGVPSVAEYWHMGATTIRFSNVVSRRFNGWKRLEALFWSVIGFKVIVHCFFVIMNYIFCLTR
jgi:phage shock protein PspC (stress-responsive transcriptional regulator)